LRGAQHTQEPLAKWENPCQAALDELLFLSFSFFRNFRFRELSKLINFGLR